MAADLSPIFASLKPVLASCADRLITQADTPTEYTVATKSPSPFPQHKGQPLFFGSVRLGKAYVSLHLLPLYMNPKLKSKISPALQKRMQGKACFNFKSDPDPQLVVELKQLAEKSLAEWADKKWL